MGKDRSPLSLNLVLGPQEQLISYQGEREGLQGHRSLDGYSGKDLKTDIRHRQPWEKCALIQVCH